jgi:hypothetical protein
MNDTAFFQFGSWLMAFGLTCRSNETPSESPIDALGGSENHTGRWSQQHSRGECCGSPLAVGSHLRNDAFGPRLIGGQWPPFRAPPRELAFRRGPGSVVVSEVATPSTTDTHHMSKSISSFSSASSGASSAAFCRVFQRVSDWFGHIERQLDKPASWPSVPCKSMVSAPPTQQRMFGTRYESRLSVTATALVSN